MSSPSHKAGLERQTRPVLWKKGQVVDQTVTSSTTFWPYGNPGLAALRGFVFSELFSIPKNETSKPRTPFNKH